MGEGIMRFPHVNGRYSEDAFRFMEIAMSEGINYYDTAFTYTGSEEFIGHALIGKYPRDSIVIADKLPVWQCSSLDDMETIFKLQLERLRVDFIDIYLLHALNADTWAQVYSKGVLDFIENKKKEGLIRCAGFSFHDRVEYLPQIVNSYDWNLIQLQINYYDWEIRDTKNSYEIIVKMDIPIVVMEPVGGGRLAKLPHKAVNLMKSVNYTASLPSWAIRFCASLPGVEVVLSGMTTEIELRDNLSCFNPSIQLNGSELACLNDVVHVIHNSGSIPCSACRYCVEECPVGIDIPHVFQIYNDYVTFNQSLAWAYMTMIPSSRQVDKCIKCGNCAQICPQKIEIPNQLLMVHENAVIDSLFGQSVDSTVVFNACKGTPVILFGAGVLGKSMLKYARKHGLDVRYFCDNGSHLWGSKINGVNVISPNQLRALYDEINIKVLITNLNAYNEIKKQLISYGITPVN